MYNIEIFYKALFFRFYFFFFTGTLLNQNVRNSALGLSKFPIYHSDKKYTYKFLYNRGGCTIIVIKYNCNSSFINISAISLEQICYSICFKNK